MTKKYSQILSNKGKPSIRETLFAMALHMTKTFFTKPISQKLIKMRLATFLCVFLSLIIDLSAQSTLDSLLLVWEDPTNPDSIRAQAFTDYIYEGDFNSNPDSAILLANQLYEFTENTDYKIGTVDALNLSGYIYFNMGQYIEALDAYQRGLKIAEEIGDKYGEAGFLEKIGFIYHDNADLMMALNYYQRSLELFEEIDDIAGISSIYNEYGSIYRVKMDYEKSLEYFEKALAFNDELNDEYGKSATYLNKGQLLLEKEDYTSAIENFQKGLLLYEELGDKLGIASGLAGIGDVYAMQGDDEKALEYFQRSLSISEEIKDIRGISATLLSTADLYFNQGNYTASIQNCNRSLELAKGLGDIDNQLGACYCLYDAYKGLGNLKEAIANLEQVLTLSDSIKDEESGQKLQQMEFSKLVLQDSIETAERERLAEEAFQEEIRQKDKARNIIFSIAALILILAGGLYLRLRSVRKSRAILKIERDRSESLLLNILPAEIAQELKEKGRADARDFDMASILFTDFKGFTAASEKLNAQELVAEINTCFEAFDGIMAKYGIEKIKTIGDAYMAAGGLPVPTDDSLKKTVLAALEMQAFIGKRKAELDANGLTSFEMRVGIHTGPVVAGIVGVKKFQYDIWGDTVNTASRLESMGEVGKVNIGESSYELLKDDPDFIFESRGKIEAKGKGEIKMWFIKLKG